MIEIFEAKREAEKLGYMILHSQTIKQKYFIDEKAKVIYYFHLLDKDPKEKNAILACAIVRIEYALTNSEKLQRDLFLKLVLEKVFGTDENFSKACKKSIGGGNFTAYLSDTFNVSQNLIEKKMQMIKKGK